MNVKTLAITLALIFTGLIGGAYLSFNSSAQQAVVSSQDAKAEQGETSLDWGEIVMNAGNAEATFTIRSKGTTPLKLFNIITSCACTTAQLSNNGTDSPLFGMHSKSDYVMELAPGEEATLKVVFDPAYHGPSGVGPIMRTVTIETNDPANPTLTYTLTGTVRSN